MTGNGNRREADGSARIASGNGDLTARECDVLGLVGAGHGDAEIAEILGIAHSTVATLLRASMAKLGAHTRREAVASWRQIRDHETPN